MKSKIILLVEDEPPMAIVIQDSLRRDGFNVLTAKNGVEGLSIAKERHPDLILLDILMPKMDGLSMLNELRKDSWGSAANVVILTNYSDDEKKSIAANAGAVDFWLKADMSLEDIVFRIKEKFAHISKFNT